MRLLAGVFLGDAVLIAPLGFPIAGALLFWGSAYALGSRGLPRDPLIAAGLSLVTCDRLRQPAGRRPARRPVDDLLGVVVMDP